MIEKMILDFFIWLGADKIDVFIVLMLVWVFIRQSAISHSNRQLDKLALLHGHILRDKLGINTVKIHRNKDYEIVQPLNDE